MRRSPLFHLTLGAIAVLFAGAVGQIANYERPRQREAWRGGCETRRSCRAKSPAVPGGVTWTTRELDAPAKVIVKLRSGVLTQKLIGELLHPVDPTRANTGIYPTPEVELFASLPSLSVMRFGSRSTAELALDMLRRDPRVEHAELDAVWHVDAAGAGPTDARYAEQWGLENTGQAINGKPAGTAGVDIDALNAWQHGQGSEDVVVAVIDSGVDYDHEDLAANMWRNPGEVPGNGIDDDRNGVVDDVYGYNAVDDSGDPADDLGHGTHVAGILGAVGDNQTGVAGVNWTTRIMALKFLGPGGGGTTSDAIACIDYLLKAKARGANVRVVNCSWGSTMASKALEEAIDDAVGEGVLFVCASGNDALDCDRIPHYPSSYESEGVVSVAALQNDDTLARFSNWGRSSVDVAAPGVDVLSTLPNGSYGFASGTSMASPFVAGVAALVAEQDPKMPVARIRERILGGTYSVPDFGRRLATGGRLSGSGAFAGLASSGLGH
jgi:subtilisin family serine protease